MLDLAAGLGYKSYGPGQRDVLMNRSQAVSWECDA